MVSEHKNQVKRVKLTIKFIGFDKKSVNVEVDKSTTYSELMQQLNINPETVVIVKDSMPIPLDEKVEEGEITVMRVISGG